MILTAQSVIKSIGKLIATPKMRQLWALKELAKQHIGEPVYELVTSGGDSFD